MDSAVADRIVAALGLNDVRRFADLPRWEQAQLLVDACIDAGLSPVELGFCLD